MQTETKILIYWFVLTLLISRDRFLPTLVWLYVLISIVIAITYLCVYVVVVKMSAASFFTFRELCRDEFGIGESVRVICLLCLMLISRFNAAICITGFTGSCICRGVFVWVSYFFLLLLVCSFFGGGAKFLLFRRALK